MEELKQGFQNSYRDPDTAISLQQEDKPPQITIKSTFTTVKTWILQIRLLLCGETRGTSETIDCVLARLEIMRVDGIKTLTNEHLCGKRTHKTLDSHGSIQIGSADCANAFQRFHLKHESGPDGPTDDRKTDLNAQAIKQGKFPANKGS
jgi:hypothetical protein